MKNALPVSVLTPCPKCNGMRVGVDCSSEMDVRAAGHFVSDLRAVVCLNCGYTELYTLDLPKLRQAIARNPERFQLPPDFGR